MQHDDSKCPKFSSAVEIEYKRLTYKVTIVTSKKVTKPNRIFLNFIFNFFPTTRPSFSGGLSRKPTNNKHVALWHVEKVWLKTSLKDSNWHSYKIISLWNFLNYGWIPLSPSYTDVKQQYIYTTNHNWT
jgi:hypothetical protein